VRRSGLIIWAAGQALIGRALFTRQGRSTGGVRLTAIGLGLFALGLLIGLVVTAMERGTWPVAVAIVLVTGWLPVACFRFAARVSTDGDAGP
jgi:hypothetical protein